MKKILLSFVAIAGIGFFAGIARATDYGVTPATITILAGGSTSDAQGVAMTSGTVPGACPNRFYILNTDKQLYAAALTAATNNKTVYLRVKDSEPSKYLDPHGSTTCRLVALTW